MKRRTHLDDESPRKTGSGDGRHVLFVGLNYSPEPTGIAPYTTGMAEGLAARGWNVSAITTFPHYPWWTVPEEYAGLPRHARVNDVDVTRIPLSVPRRPNAISRALFEIGFGVKALLRPWKSTDAVVLVSPALLSSRIVAYKARLRGIPVVTWVQDIYTLGVSEAGRGRGAKLIAAIERGLAQASDRVVVIHDRFRRALVEGLDVTQPIDVVRNWSHVPTIRLKKRAKTRAKLGWGDDDIIVLHSGAIGAKQGLENVVHAARAATQRGSRVRFVLLGDGNQRAALEAMGPDPALQYIDPLPDAAFFDTLAAADVLLVNERPGLTEMSVPSKLTTYFATGLPVVAAVDATSTTFDEVTAAGAGPIVPAGDPEALVTAVEEIAADPAQAIVYGEAGRDYRERVLSPEAAVDAFEATLEAACRTAGASIERMSPAEARTSTVGA